MAKPEQIELSKIRIDGGTQSRFALRPAVVREYSEAVDRLPPVDLFFDGTDYWLADGFHRYHAHANANRPKIAAHIHPGSKRDAILFAAGANGKHGIPRDLADKEKAIELLLNDPEWREWSFSRIAETCDVSWHLVKKCRNAFTSSGGLTSRRRGERAREVRTIRYKTKWGTIAEMNVRNIGKYKRQSKKSVAGK